MTHPLPSPVPAEHHAPAALHAYRLVVWTAVIIVTLVLVQQPRPTLPEPPTQQVATLDNLAGDFADAEARKDRNERTADSAPKQQVVNGWYTNDLLEIVGSQVDSLLRIEAQLLDAQSASASAAHNLAVAQADDHRTESLIAVLGLGLAAHVAGSSLILLLTRRPRRNPSGVLDTPVEPEPTAPWSDTQPFDPRPVTHP